MIKIIELFGGISSPIAALNRMNTPYESVLYVENDKRVVKARNYLYKTNHEPFDIRDVKVIPKADILIHGSPCQDFSTGGDQKGGEKGSGTRSSLLWETVRILKTNLDALPEVIIWENVKGALSKKNRPVIDDYIAELKALGYTSYIDLANAREMSAIPQNRERVFIVSTLNAPYEVGFVKVPMRDINEFLEKNVSEYYTLTQEWMLKPLAQGKFNVIKDYCYTISTKPWRWNNAGVVQIGENKFRILTERECYRLMGFDDWQFSHIAHMPKTLLYQMAGNSIVVDVIAKILKKVIPNELQTKEFRDWYTNNIYYTI